MRILRYAFRNIIRNPFLSLSSTFVIALLLFFVNILIFVLFLSENFIGDVQSRIKFTINYQSGYALESLKSTVLIDSLRSTFSGITVTPISREESYVNYARLYPDLISIIEGTGENPFPDSLAISGIPLDRYDEFNVMILNEREMFYYDADILGQRLLDFRSQYQRIASIVSSLRLFEYGIFALLGLFAFTVATIIYNVVSNSVFFHSQEIEIIELVGGKPGFIYGQFLLQALFYATTALILAFVFLRSMASFVDQARAEKALSLFESTIVLFFTSLQSLFLIELVFVAVISLISASIALRKYIHKTMVL